MERDYFSCFKEGSHATLEAAVAGIMEMLPSGDFVSTISILPCLSPAQFLYEGDSDYFSLSQASPAVVKEGESLTESLPIA